MIIDVLGFVVETYSDPVFGYVHKSLVAVPALISILTSVLAIIQEKLNNPSPDDPFEPEIAAVCSPLFILRPISNLYLTKFVCF